MCRWPPRQRRSRDQSDSNWNRNRKRKRNEYVRVGLDAELRERAHGRGGGAAGGGRPAGPAGPRARLHAADEGGTCRPALHGAVPARQPRGRPGREPREQRPRAQRPVARLPPRPLARGRAAVAARRQPAPPAQGQLQLSDRGGQGRPHQRCPAPHRLELLAQHERCGRSGGGRGRGQRWVIEQLAIEN
jgi:hypothetical protein